MCIHSDGLLAVGIPQDDIGRFPPDAGKRSELFQRLRDLSIKNFFDHLATPNNTLGLVMVKPGGPNIFFESPEVRFGKITGLAVFLEKARGHLIYPLICALGGQDGGDEELERVTVVQGNSGVRVFFLQDIQDFYYRSLRFQFRPFSQLCPM